MGFSLPKLPLAKGLNDPSNLRFGKPYKMRGLTIRSLNQKAGRATKGVIGFHPLGLKMAKLQQQGFFKNNTV